MQSEFTFTQPCAFVNLNKCDLKNQIDAILDNSINFANLTIVLKGCTRATSDDECRERLYCDSADLTDNSILQKCTVCNADNCNKESTGRHRIANGIEKMRKRKYGRNIVKY